MRNTLARFIDYYNADKIQIICGKHLINIDCKVEGSLFIVRHFENTKFYFKSFENGLLIVSTNE